MKIQHAARSDRGLVREANEDSWSADPELGLYVVSDGIGGHAAGELASQVVVESLPGMVRKCFPLPVKEFTDKGVESMNSLLFELSNIVRAKSNFDASLKGMGATVVLAMVTGQQALIAHMGDSRAYGLRDDTFDQLTQDHTVVQTMLENGKLSEREAARHPAKSILTRSIGMIAKPVPECQLIEIAAGDRFLLCSDGLTGEVDETRIQELLASAVEPGVAVETLTNEAIANGGRDNITTLAVFVDQ